MTFTPRYQQVCTRLTELEMKYVERLAAKAGKRPGGWVHMVIKERILAEIAGPAGTLQPVPGRLSEPNSDPNTKSVPSHALTGDG